MKLTVTIRKKDVPDEKRIIEAPTRFAVYEMVEKEGGIVVGLQEGVTVFRLPQWTNITFGTGIKQIEIITTTKNLAAMLSSGLSLSRALSIIERQVTNKSLKRLMVEVGDSIQKGSSLHEALAKHPKVFSSLFIAMAKAGEESGSLAASLSIVGMQMERTYALIRKLKGAMIYPGIVLTAIFIVGILMLIYVVPTLTATFSSLGVELPLATRIIVALSDFMVAHVVVVLGLIVLMATGVIFFVRSAFGGALVLRGALFIPVIGELVRETYAARTARTLASLLSSGVPVLSALAITGEVVHAPLFTQVISEAETNVKKGGLLSTAFVEHPKLYPILMGDMLAVGEETGKVDDMLKRTAEFYEEDVSEKTKDFSTIVEPILILFIGAFVGIFAVAMIAPIYSLSSAF
ncbi:MAG TPA: type II secretion system F family protein [Candidatus Paceibacterota bacterium]|nr:type II secretion system F family protein [Candidatus Paceibacterota bacterium]